VTDPLDGYRPRLDDLTDDEAVLHQLERDGITAGYSVEQIRRIRLGQDAVSFVKAGATPEEQARIGTYLVDRAKQEMETFLEISLQRGLDHPVTREAYDLARGAAIMVGWLDGAISDYLEAEKLDDEQRAN